MLAASELSRAASVTDIASEEGGTLSQYALKAWYRGTGLDAVCALTCSMPAELLRGSAAAVIGLTTKPCPCSASAAGAVAGEELSAEWRACCHACSARAGDAARSSACMTKFDVVFIRLPQCQMLGKVSPSDGACCLPRHQMDEHASASCKPKDICSSSWFHGRVFRDQQVIRHWSTHKGLSWQQKRPLHRLHQPQMSTHAANESHLLGDCNAPGRQQRSGRGRPQVDVLRRLAPRQHTLPLGGGQEAQLCIGYLQLSAQALQRDGCSLALQPSTRNCMPFVLAAHIKAWCSRKRRNMTQQVDLLYVKPMLKKQCWQVVMF